MCYFTFFVFGLTDSFDLKPKRVKSISTANKPHKNQNQNPSLFTFSMPTISHNVHKSLTVPMLFCPKEALKSTQLQKKKKNHSSISFNNVTWFIYISATCELTPHCLWDLSNSLFWINFNMYHHSGPTHAKRLPSYVAQSTFQSAVATPLSRFI